MDSSAPGSFVLHYLPEFSQILVHWVGDAIQLFHPLPLSSFACNLSSLRVFPLSQLFTSGDQSIEASASVLPMNIQGWFLLGLTGLSSLQSKGLSSAFSSTTIRKHQSFSTQLSLWSNFHVYTWLLEKTIHLTLLAKWCLCFLICCLGLS